jgi:hypothetical protein
MGNLSRPRRRQAFVFEQHRQLIDFDRWAPSDLRFLVRDLAVVELVLGATRQEGTGAHGERARGRLGNPADEHRRLGDVGAGQPSDNGQRYKEPVLEAQHEFPNP